MKYSIHKITDKVYHIQFNNQYDLSMFFVRYQEHYESPNPKFRGKAFTLVDYMEWWSKDHNGVFTYPAAWGGFNCPASAINNVFKLSILDYNKYDETMAKINVDLLNKSNGDYYLIGTYTDKKLSKPSKKDLMQGVLSHELCHGLFYSVRQYRESMIYLVERLPKKFRVQINKWLKSIGYTEEVFIDEIQAYLSTGSPFEKEFPELHIPFRETFKKFAKETLK